ncbi:nickel-dependent hydrogenase large subunit [Nocardioides sp. GY 10127]|uniref:nickel-dependent hydrogenase large subunit n=1 Tax=Nocardioides sp. GY 10127 TaxID=2569762 RepID=UPI0014586895|nr:nickel-dependent hydrogenase large subunit [Nocardioides sp. GY 10127]
MSTRTLRLDAVVDADAAQVLARRGADGAWAEARFALDSLPRIEPLLRGRPVTDVPRIVERLCGICPAAHHLAGVRALESLTGLDVSSATARARRRLLHHATVAQEHARHLTHVSGPEARAVHAAATRLVAAASGDRHFPVCAVPGGSTGPLDAARVAGLRGPVADALDAAAALLRGAASAEQGDGLPPFAGHDLALVDEDGRLDLLGTRLRGRDAEGRLVVADVAPSAWPALVSEERPGASAPRTFLTYLGTPGDGRVGGAYRVGPLAQLRVAALSTPRAERARRAWLAARPGAAAGGATTARAVVLLHALEVAAALLEDPALTSADDMTAPPVVPPAAGGTGVGWVDGARGLLVHLYVADADGRLADARITTPTAQNERWLGELLSALLRAGVGSGLEAAVRAADPCLPCSSAPVGGMHLTVAEEA